MTPTKLCSPRCYLRRWPTSAIKNGIVGNNLLKGGGGGKRDIGWYWDIGGLLKLKFLYHHLYFIHTFFYDKPRFNRTGIDSSWCSLGCAVFLRTSSNDSSSSANCTFSSSSFRSSSVFCTSSCGFSCCMVIPSNFDNDKVVMVIMLQWVSMKVVKNDTNA